MSLIPVILCGGSGTRLWPMSRGGYPKQYLPLVGEHSLVQQAALRLKGFPGALAPIFISNTDQRFLLAEQMNSIAVKPQNIVLEPVGRNTAPAVAVAAILAQRVNPDALILVLPSDHVIPNQALFHQLVQQASEIAANGKLVTFGIKPESAHTGYGYIRRGAALMAGGTCFEVDRFVEKPDLKRAQEFVDDGNYYWNSGMFLFKASTYLAELGQFSLEILKQAELAISNGQQDPDFMRLDTAAFAASPADSIDYAVMEKTAHAAVIEAEGLGWNDIGSWTALAEITPKDEFENSQIGDVIAENTRNCYIRADHRMVATVGVQDLIIIETADAILVAHQDQAQDVKKIVERLNATGRSESVTHRRVYRPWGWYEGLDECQRFQVKRILVSPGRSLSLQMHHHRAEHWIVVKGTALIVNGSQELMLSENQSTYIPLGTTHRLTNPGKIPLEIIEVQSGCYLGEDDIVRFEDQYGRQTATEV
ncbi:mannose-1-phosphate guanylyltransferase/mannose-6-phosphate isomerase [Deefgea sp. CFH1-16]|uniref:mannose-1-phosphate guanylyltransferase/mannose-6-phosphate isomerase n=1 Tax=Deefgea sp. CFH1-16 TaxID=2675457 RepID=UPI0015F453E5|nr:mannose-1-phosphate guanylyltransferase/mannose-6-phosphate isomerase [Deefgea sp. CFH1-16]MBM5574158.1 mannose-1-phosphate guanylyltransferase/mannose-6-phosphate isomerase [Deefgea sp. CFH1-16]